MDPNCQQGAVQAGGGSIMLLGDHLQPFMDFTYPNNDGIFMDDNAPCHRSTTVRDWFEEHSGQFQRMIWPPRPPDMNPIEHLWDIIERSVRAQNPAPSTLSQLMERLERQHGSIFLQKTSNNLLSPCHVELLHFAGRKEDLHDIKTYPMTFVTSVASQFREYQFTCQASQEADFLSFQALCGIAYIYDRARLLRFWFGVKPIVLFFKPETVEVVLSSNALLEKTFVYDFLAPWFKQGLITSSGAKWRKRRKLLTPAFHFRILDDFLPVIDSHARFLAEKLREQVGNKSFDLVPYITLCSLDILCETAMGKYVGAQKKDTPYIKALSAASHLFGVRFMKPWLWPEFVFGRTAEGRKFKESTDTMDAFTRGVIRERKQFIMSEVKGGSNLEDAFKKDDYGMKRRKAFLDLLLYEHLSDPCFTEEDITEEVNTFMFAGHDTTAVGMSWALYLIGQDPEVQKKLQDELEEVFGDDYDRPFEVEDLKNLKYLECVLKESQRLYPSLPYIGRESSCDVVVNGYTIPAGTNCMIFTYMLHRDSDVFPNPEKFDPDRFLPENATGRHPYAYVPFSAGPRNCIGQRFAMMEEKVVLAHVLMNYEVKSLVPRDQLQLTAEMVLRSHNGIIMQITPRQR
ncbi:cytochrome P450 4c3-like [Uloborus diversus]|uniref:cytochrome P450 4c3-like n=1 Tax=Uloborus diversus TaxID=327109 RepID=UPI0024092EB8|nr:cytochrome P450 4c3-like [Uloborus diversus]